MPLVVRKVSGVRARVDNVGAILRSAKGVIWRMALFLAAGLSLFGSEDEGPLRSLHSVWESGVANHTGYEASRAGAMAEEAEARAVRRETIPSLSVEASADYGQRVRPGEERDQGVAGRGEVLARVDWLLYESSRAARERAVELRREGIVHAGEAFDYAYRAEMARLYVQASAAEEKVAALREEETTFSGLLDRVALRVRNGVETASAREWLEETQSSYRERLHEARNRNDGLSARLTAIAGREVAPTPVHPRFGGFGPMPEVGDNPALAELRLLAEERRAEADSILRRDRWRVEAFGTTGPYFSEAFDDRVKHEYFGGMRLVWSPDTSGVQRERALAERRRARALEAEATGLRERHWQRTREIGVRLDDAESRLAGSAELMESSERAARAADLRWQRGVGTWREVAERRGALLDARLQEIELREALALLLVEYAEISAALEALPVWLGEGEES